MSEPVRHPSTHALFVEAATRWVNLRDVHRAAERRMWIGALVTQFSDAELVLLNAAGYLCPDDIYRLRRAGRPVRMPAAHRD